MCIYEENHLHHFTYLHLWTLLHVYMRCMQTYLCFELYALISAYGADLDLQNKVRKISQAFQAWRQAWRLLYLHVCVCVACFFLYLYHICI